MRPCRSRSRRLVHIASSAFVALAVSYLMAGTIHTYDLAGQLPGTATEVLYTVTGILSFSLYWAMCIQFRKFGEGV